MISARPLVFTCASIQSLTRLSRWLSDSPPSGAASGRLRHRSKPFASCSATHAAVLPAHMPDDQAASSVSDVAANPNASAVSEERRSGLVQIVLYRPMVSFRWLTDCLFKGEMPSSAGNLKARCAAVGACDRKCSCVATA